MRLRYYQSAATTAVQTNVSSGKKDNLVVIPVGGGKSVIIGHLALWAISQAPNKKAMLLAHRTELSKQNAQKITTIDPSISLGFEKAEEICAPQNNIMVASIQTVGKEGLERVRRWASPKDIAIVLIDEAHHIPGGKTYQTLLKELRQENPDIMTVGFTATPKRADGEKIEDWIDTLAYEISMAELVENKYLARIRAYKVKTETSLAAFANDKKKDFDERELTKLVNNQARNQLALDTYRAKHKEENALCFCVSKAHAKDTASLFQAAGIPCEAITEDTPDKERERILEEFKAGKIKVLTSVAVLTEGFDAPRIKALFMLRPTKSPVLLEQMLGRGLRLVAYPNPEDPEGEWLIDWEAKSECHIYDFVDQKATQVGAQTVTGMLGLNGDLELNGEDLFALKSKIEAQTNGNPLLAAAVAQAYSPEEIEALLQSHNLLAELEAIRYVPNQKADWMALSPTESWFQLPQGETIRVFRNPLGSFEMECPPINLKARRASQEEYQQKNPGRDLPPIPEANHPTEDLHIIGENGRLHLLGETLSSALKEATDYLLKLLPCDYSLINKNAKWRDRAKTEKATEGQLRNINRLKIPLSEEEKANLTKLQASELIDKAELQKKLAISQGRIPFGKYKGLPAFLVRVYDPGYIFHMLQERKDFLTQQHMLEAFQIAAQENPLPWLAQYRPRIYHKDFAGMESSYEKDFAKDPEDVYKVIKFALDQDPMNQWKILQEAV